MSLSSGPRAFIAATALAASAFSGCIESPKVRQDIDEPVVADMGISDLGTIIDQGTVRADVGVILNDAAITDATVADVSTADMFVLDAAQVQDGALSDLDSSLPDAALPDMATPDAAVPSPWNNPELCCTSLFVQSCIQPYFDENWNRVENPVVDAWCINYQQELCDENERNYPDSPYPICEGEVPYGFGADSIVECVYATLDDNGNRVRPFPDTPICNTLPVDLDCNPCRWLRGENGSFEGIECARPLQQ